MAERRMHVAVSASMKLAAGTTLRDLREKYACVLVLSCIIRRTSKTTRTRPTSHGARWVTFRTCPILTRRKQKLGHVTPTTLPYCSADSDAGQTGLDSYACRVPLQREPKNERLLPKRAYPKAG